ncbi:MAG: protein kinase [Rubrivivax sp.]|jgi:hypothetical protein
MPWPPHDSTLDRLRSGALAGATTLDLRGAGLHTLPPEVLHLADTLEVLDLSGNALPELPAELARCTRLHTLFASNNRFKRLPEVLGRLPRLDTLGFKANQIAEVPAAALAPSLRWLILTDNRVAELPPTLTDCTRLEKLMLAGNRLQRWPAGLEQLQRLELLRLSANAFQRLEEALPDELLQLPALTWLAHAGNPFGQAWETAAAPGEAGTAAAVHWAELQLQERLGEGASGHIHAATWQPADGGPARPVAVKLFKAAVTSDGWPASEMAATLRAGTHPGQLGVCGPVQGHPEGRPALVLPRLPAGWRPLAGPPSMASCTRDVYDPALRLPPSQAAAIAAQVAAALDHLHARGLTHGDLYAHNLLVDGQGGALISDFGAASWCPPGDAARADRLRAIDRRAFAVLQAELALLA